MNVTSYHCSTPHSIMRHLEIFFLRLRKKVKNYKKVLHPLEIKTASITL
jgi:hypothetical protein